MKPKLFLTKIYDIKLKAMGISVRHLYAIKLRVFQFIALVAARYSSKMQVFAYQV